MNISHRLQHAGFRALLAVASLLPLPVLFPVFRALASACRVIGIRRRVVRENLRAAFGKDLPAAELAGIERGCYAEYGRIVLEIVASDRLLRRGEGYFEALGLPILEEAV